MYFHRQSMTFFITGCFLLVVGTNVSAETSSSNEHKSSFPLTIVITPEKTISSVKSRLLKDTPSLVSFTIENQTDAFIILRGLTFQKNLPDINRWYGPRYGSVAYDALSDLWVYNEMNQTLSKSVFAMGIIKPYGKYEIQRWVVPRTDTLHVDITYQKLSEVEALDHLYFNTAGEKEFSLKHTFAHLPNKDALRKKNLDTSFIIFPQADKVTFSTQHLLCAVALQEPEFSFKDVTKKVVGEIRDQLFWKSNTMWVVQTDTAVFLVSKDIIEQLGAIDLASFILIEASPQYVDCLLPVSGYEEFGMPRPHFEGPGYFNPGVTHIHKGKIIPLLRYATSHNDPITLFVYDAHGLGKQMYLLVGDFNEKARRRMAIENNE